MARLFLDSAAPRTWASKMNVRSGVSSGVTSDDTVVPFEVSMFFLGVICFESSFRSSSISSWASFSFRRVLGVVFAAVDIDIPVERGPLSAFCLSLSICSVLNSN